MSLKEKWTRMLISKDIIQCPVCHYKMVRPFRKSCPKCENDLKERIKAIEEAEEKLAKAREKLAQEKLAKVREKLAYNPFMVFEIDDSGERVRLSITKEQLREYIKGNMLDSTNVFIIYIENSYLCQIYIWKGSESSIKKQINIRKTVSNLQSDLESLGYSSPCRVVSMKEGQKPTEFYKALSIKKEHTDEDGYSPFPYIFKPPAPPDDLALSGEPQAKVPLTKQVLVYETYCKHCGAELPEGQTICHVCGKKVR